MLYKCIIIVRKKMIVIIQCFSLGGGQIINQFSEISDSDDESDIYSEEDVITEYDSDVGMFLYICFHQTNNYY